MNSLEENGETASDLRYEDALAELQTILNALEEESVDVDLLASQVARADELIRHCRDRIDAARLQVDRVVDALEQE
ncbi:MAG TPA: exodeoxyribonuclease VII small subunit [Acidimicrobiales bacterium]|nr:exodeoxyribonuclease VII small subunit [Acidimicrobiales bacterium]|tara:strand:- start:215 stop:442 length:228 start_codon:yes stop_codon:yes gene_type:complete